MKKLNILILNWRDITHPWAGGAEIHLHEIAKRLRKRGHDVTLICGGYENCKTHDKIDGINITRVGDTYSYYYYVLKNFLYRTIKIHENYDLIIEDINKIPFFTPLFDRAKKLAIIHHLNGKIFFKELPLPVAIVAYISEKMIPLIYRNVPFVVVSDSAKAELSKIGIPDKSIHVIHNGLNNGIFKRSNLSHKARWPTIVYLGRLKRYKRIDLLVRAMKIIAEKIPRSRLLIIGSGDAKGELESLVAQLDLKNHIKFTNYVQEKEKVRLLSKAWVCVNPSLKEGWGITVIEANACGTPAIAYDVPGLRDSILDGKTGILVKENGNFEKLAEAILAILKDEELRKKLSKNALEWSKEFTWDKSAREFEKVMEAAVNE